MAHYRLYCIGSDGRFFRCEEIQAADDADAIRQSLALRGAYAAELWCGDRMVTAFRSAASAA